MSSSSSTPSGAGPSTTTSAKKTKSPPSKTTKHTKEKAPLFTPLMRDAQARNKEPYLSSDSDSEIELGNKRFDVWGNDTYENMQRRREAAVVLDSPELLMMFANGRNDSVPGTRLYFLKMLAGYHDQEDEESSVRTEEEKGKEKEKSKMKPPHRW